MRSMAIDRRSAMGLVGGLLAAVGLRRPAQAADLPGGFLACARMPDGSHALARMDRSGAVTASWPLPDRGHAMAVSPDRRTVVVIARRPGIYGVAIDLASGTEVNFEAPEGRHFEGHGAFSPDGHRLYIAENAYEEDGRSAVGIYDATNGFARVGDWSGGGVGVHELILSADGRTIIIANGGVRTHPDFPRLELEPDAMEPSLVLLDAASGAEVARFDAPADLKRLSLRHVALSADGAIWIGAQWRGNVADDVPMIAKVTRADGLVYVPLDAATRRGFKGYIGSVAADLSGRHIAFSSPVGAQITLVDTVTEQAVGQVELPDGCGVAPFDARSILVTSGLGAVATLGPGRARTLATSPLAWDNHMRAV